MINKLANILSPSATPNGKVEPTMSVKQTPIPTEQLEDRRPAVVVRTVEAKQHRSAVAAEAAARWEALEAEREHLQHSLSVSEASNRVLERTNEALQVEVASLRFENERLLRENTAIHTRVNIAAETLLALRKPLPDKVESGVEQAITDALMTEDVEHNLGGSTTDRMTHTTPNFEEIERDADKS